MMVDDCWSMLILSAMVFFILHTSTVVCKVRNLDGSKYFEMMVTYGGNGLLVLVIYGRLMAVQNQQVIMFWWTLVNSGDLAPKKCELTMGNRNEPMGLDSRETSRWRRRTGAPLWQVGKGGFVINDWVEWWMGMSSRLAIPFSQFGWGMSSHAGLHIARL